jgi:hypothetical protein
VKLAPLKRIKRLEKGADGVTMEVLECNHKQPVREDRIGPTYAKRRRCVKCKR